MMKLINNFVRGAQAASFAEGLAMVHAAGLDQAKTVHSVRRWYKRDAYTGDSPLGLASQQTIDGLLRRFAEDVPKRDIDRADRGHADSLAAEGHGLAIHVLPQELGVPRILTEQQRLQVEVDRLFRDLGRERGVANPD